MRFVIVQRANQLFSKHCATISMTVSKIDHVRDNYICGLQHQWNLKWVMVFATRSLALVAILFVKHRGDNEIFWRSNKHLWTSDIATMSMQAITTTLGYKWKNKHRGKNYTRANLMGFLLVNATTNQSSATMLPSETSVARLWMSLSTEYKLQLNERKKKVRRE